MNLTDRLITAIVGKCDGLSITAEQASNILAYLQYGAPLPREAATVWQPIETAPKDGTRLLARNDDYGVRETHWAFYGEGSPAKERFKQGNGPSGSWHWHEPQSHWASSWEPTHWMPLLAAPAAASNGEQK